MEQYFPAPGPTKAEFDALSSQKSNLVVSETVTGTTDANGGIDLSLSYPPSQYACIAVPSRAYNNNAYFAFIFVNIAESNYVVDVRKRDGTALASATVKLYVTYIKK